MERGQSPRYEIPERAEKAPQQPLGWNEHPAIGYILPFAVFIAFLMLGRYVSIPQPLRFVAVMAVIAFFSRGILSWRPSQPLASVALGIAVFFIWIGPDALIPGYRNFILFSNSIVGHPQASTQPADQASFMFLIFRVLGSVVAVPILEELFWRGWMMRWIIEKDFTKVPLGTYQVEAFWIVAALFASEHGSYWDVGLLTGVIYNWWAIRTKNLTDCILAHAVTNGCLAIYVIFYGQWQYWL